MFSYFGLLVFATALFALIATVGGDSISMYGNTNLFSFILHGLQVFFAIAFGLKAIRQGFIDALEFVKKSQSEEAKDES